MLSPDGAGSYRVGEVLGDYYYAPGQVLPHRRRVRWLEMSIDRSSMSEALQSSMGSIGTVSNVSDHHAELEALLGQPIITLVTGDPQLARYRGPVRKV